MGVSHTASKRVLQVQAAVNPESCCLWFAFSPQHFALQTQQLCRRISGNCWSGQHSPERRYTKCQSVQEPRLFTAAHQQFADSLAGAKGPVEAHLRVYCQQVACSHLQEKSNHGFVTLLWAVSEFCCTAGI